MKIKVPKRKTIVSPWYPFPVSYFYLEVEEVSMEDQGDVIAAGISFGEGIHPHQLFGRGGNSNERT